MDFIELEQICEASNLSSVEKDQIYLFVEKFSTCKMFDSVDMFLERIPESALRKIKEKGQYANLRQFCNGLRSK